MAPAAAIAAEAPGGDEIVNRLAREDSPYLRQHASNPVDWFPWGKEALAKARAENKPIFLSVGYSSCHWCHVMARESFADAEVAAALNGDFISIKVDRERRPDLDETYMLATQFLTRTGGGWPNTVFLTPDLKPFFAGTYFPRDDFLGLVKGLAARWTSDQKAVTQRGDEVAGAISRFLNARLAAQEITPTALTTAADEILTDLDRLSGGFGEQAKFPQETVLLLLLRLAELDGHAASREAIKVTLHGMLNGGIQDHVGGGFHRYAVDANWQVPHFEKMLYNQALIARLLVRAYRLTGKARYRDAARRTLDYVLYDLAAPGGGFYSSRDAESDGAEGRYYTWTPEELRAALGDADAALASQVFSADGSGQVDGRSVLHMALSPEFAAALHDMDEAAFAERLDRIRAKLAAFRSKRPAPFRDTKIIASWNGLMVAAFAEAALAFDERRYSEAALETAEFLWARLRGPDGGLWRMWFEGRAGTKALLEDYAALIIAFVKVRDLGGSDSWLARARALSANMTAQFRDQSAGDFFASTSETGFVRPKLKTDAQLPGSNALALEALALLSRRVDDPDPALHAEGLLSALSGQAFGSPSAHAYSLFAADILRRGESGPRQYLAKGHVRASVRASGDDGTVTLRLEIRKGWHVNSDKPSQADFVATEVSVVGASATVRYPAPVTRKLAFSDAPLSLFEGDSEIVISVPREKDQLLRVRLRLQACSDQICLQPESTVLALRISS